MAAKAIFGGLLSGVGEGMVSQAEARRQEALEKAKELRRQTERQEDRTFQEGLAKQSRDFQAGQAKESREFQKGLFSKTIPGEGGQVYGMTPGGEVKDLGIKAQTKNKSSKGISDKQLIDTAIKLETTKGLEGETVNTQGVAARLRAAGREDLAKLAADPTATEDSSAVKIDSPEYQKAEDMALREAKSRNPPGPDIFRGEAVRSAYGGLTEDEWVNKRTLEWYRHLTTGEELPSQPIESEPESPPQTEPTQSQYRQTSRGFRTRPEAQAQPTPTGQRTAMPAGQSASGTRENPYRPTTQAEFAQIPSGTIYLNPADGNLYRKK